MTQQLQVGSILVAHQPGPTDGDRAFRKSLILIAKQNAAGFLGVNIAGGQGPMEAASTNFLYRLRLSWWEQWLAWAWPWYCPHGFRVGTTNYALGPFVELSSWRTKAILAGGKTSLTQGYALWTNDQIAEEIRGGVWSLTGASLEEIMQVKVPERWELASKKLVSE